MYVEKPVSYDLWEGRQEIAAARKYKRIVQGGTQRRSDIAFAQLRAYLQSGELGKIKLARVLHYSQRGSIGKRDTPLTVPATCDYNLWAGPAPMEKLYRSSFHYHWHWKWSTGNGELGNNGPHSLDLARWMIGADHLAPSVLSIGGRYAWNDAGETPNTHIVHYGYEPVPIIAEVRNLPREKGAKGSDVFKGARTGIIIECEGGHAIGLSGATIYDKAGKKIKQFKGDGGRSHQANFIKAVRSRKREDLNCEIADGHLSTGLCLMGNVSHLVGKTADPNRVRETVQKDPAFSGAFARMTEHLAANGVDLHKQPPTLGAALKLDPKTETFVGTPDADAANKLRRRTYRAPFTMPETV